jgi:hypothetical protein
VGKGDQAWKPEGFVERFDAWVELEEPTDDIRLFVMAWIMSRFDDPYQDGRREQGFPNLWYAVVPGSDDGRGHVVVCSYWIEESTRTVRCDNFGTLSWPV